MPSSVKQKKISKTTCTVSGREQIIRDFFETHCIKVLASKGKDYAGGKSQSPNATFYEIAEWVGITPEQVWAVFYCKQFVALRKWIQDGELSSESLESRITDLVNYPLILASMQHNK